MGSVLKTTVARDAYDFGLAACLPQRACSSDCRWQPVTQCARAGRIQERLRLHHRKESRSPVVEDGLVVYHHVLAIEMPAQQVQCTIRLRPERFKSLAFLS